MSWNTLRNSKWALAVLLLLGLALVQQAVAQPPPPPSFYEFTITNDLPGDVTGLEVKLYKTAEGNPGAMDPVPIVMGMSAVPNDTQMVISLKKTYGIAKITVTAKCPGAPAAKTLNIQGPKGDHSVPPDQVEEYACFCLQAPAGQTNYVPRLQFMEVEGVPMMKLHGKARWDDFYSPVILDQQPCD